MTPKTFLDYYLIGDSVSTMENAKLKIILSFFLVLVFCLIGQTGTVRAYGERLRVNAPLVAPDGSSTMIYDYMQKTAIFWFGEVTNSNNYIETKTGYDNDILAIYSVVFDKYIYSEAADETSITDWDSLVYFIDLDGNQSKTEIDTRSYRFDIQAGRHGTQQNAVYRGDSGGNWQKIDKELNFGDLDTSKITIKKGYRGGDRDNSRAWAVGLYLPWSQLGMSEPPVGNIWSFAMIAYDRDNLDGTRGGTPQYWPKNNFNARNPSDWGELKFLNKKFLNWDESGSSPGNGGESYNLSYTPQAYKSGTEKTVVIRHGLDGDVIEDTCVGASEVLCSGDDLYNFGEGLNSWGGNTSSEYFHIQNQGDPADWPCFSKIYLRFPLAKLSVNKAIVSAKLKLHYQLKTSGGTQGIRSLIQAFSVGNNLRNSSFWTEDNLSWNRTPFSIENLAGRWGDRTGSSTGDWNNLPLWEWDVSRAISGFKNEDFISFALYSADTESNTGKQFVRSESFETWGDQEQRPTLEIIYADPVDIPACQYDYIKDETRDVKDLLYLLSNWGAGFSVQELLGLLENWGEC